MSEYRISRRYRVPEEVKDGKVSVCGIQLTYNYLVHPHAKPRPRSRNFSPAWQEGGTVRFEGLPQNLRSDQINLVLSRTGESFPEEVEIWWKLGPQHWIAGKK